MKKMSEVIDEWQSLYATLPPPLGEGEAYAAMLAEQWGLDHKTVLSQLKVWEKEGKVEYVGQRRANRGRVKGRIVDAYKVCAKSS